MRWSAQTYFDGVEEVEETDFVDFLLVFFALVGLVEAAVLDVVVVVAVLLEADFVAGVLVCAIRETPANARAIVALRIVETVFFILVVCPLSEAFSVFFASDSIDESFMNQA